MSVRLIVILLELRGSMLLDSIWNWQMQINSFNYFMVVVVIQKTKTDIECSDILANIVYIIFKSNQ